MALKRLDSDEKNTLNITEGIRGNTNKHVINEAGAYRLIFTSRKNATSEPPRWIKGV